MSEICTATSTSGHQCAKPAGHEEVALPSAYSALHAARNEDGVVIQIWADEPEEA